MHTASISKYEKYNDELLEEIDDDLAELIEHGSECKAGLLGSIQECVENIGKVKVEPGDIEPSASPKEILESITKKSCSAIVGRIGKRHHERIRLYG